MQAKAEVRRFSAEYKRRVVREAAECQHGEIGGLLRREGLTYTQLANWRRMQSEGCLTDKARGPQAKPNRAEVRRLEAENTGLKRKLGDAEAIIEAQKKLAALLDRLNGEVGK